ncbi:hypothetical protein M407DRAFT_20375 [Tulasnella calospora MUT 4182]|uniref:Uncharacterized protein n=1 Tax=Tulasnella calospora MUT 4182 TaxID=1051891 RepID=A0A0C3QGB8_9AGAM|nr:hypothetical protein M407DRAFT_20375 [Tulasnella calospora MUT 4182]
MVVSTRRKSGKVKEVNYAEDEVDDDTLIDSIDPAPHERSGNQSNPERTAHTSLVPEIEATSVKDFQLQEGSEDAEDYELSHGKKRKPRKPVPSATKGKRKGKARKLDTLFDKLPIEVVYNVGHRSFSW